jgi:hypothetical protein
MNALSKRGVSLLVIGGAFFLTVPFPAQAITLDKSVYNFDDRIYTTSENDARLGIFDLSTGELIYGRGNWGVGEDLTWGGGPGNYAAVETLTPCESPDYLSYAECKALDDFINEATFTILPPGSGGGGGVTPDAQESPGSGVVSYAPEMIILSPQAGAVFSREGIVGYSATDKNNRGSAEERATLGIRDNPVALFYSDKIAEWDHSVIPLADKTLIAKNLPAAGTHTWQIQDLLVGVFYRVIGEVIDMTGSYGVDISDLFTVDYTAPQFTVRTNPPVTRGQDVTISVAVSKELVDVPTVFVTQKGGRAVTVSMKGSGTDYEGTYAVVSGEDGAAKISVSGRDLAGNVGTTIVSGSTFAVGINPPPKPSVSSPRPNDVVEKDSLTVTGTTREDTTVVLTVNGAAVYHATSSVSGAFSIQNVRLAKDANRGVNTLSLATVDPDGTMSEEVPIPVKFNKKPVIELVSPADGARLSGTAVLEAKASDENLDPLLFTYEVISVRDFDPAPVATSTNRWVAVAENVPSSRFSWDAAEVEDGNYMFRIGANDGTVAVYTPPKRVTVRNASPFFRFEDGRKTFTATSTVQLYGRALTPESISPRPTIAKAEYSITSGKKWIPVDLGSGVGGVEARFSITLPNLKEGTHTTLWRVTDSRGLSGRASHPVIVDTAPPKAPLVISPKSDFVIGDRDDANLSKKGVQIHIVGRAEPESILTLTMGGAIQTAKAAVTGDFAFRDITVTHHGANEFSLTASDQAKNTGPASKVRFLYDNLPLISFIKPQASRGLRGKATLSWSITDFDKDPLQGITLGYRRGNGVFTPLPIDPAKNSFLWDVGRFPEGRDYQLKLTAGDGIATAEKVVDFSVDETPPTLASFALKKTVIGKSDVLEGPGRALDALSGIEFVEYAIAPEPLPPEHSEKGIGRS